mmetsp:Transcript_91338/g.263625  ORF Transcript_91338/g.263625 Transcript_91338/m.263625 type:complete len:216 (-) Transcript_91338:1205-1852(-)
MSAINVDNSSSTLPWLPASRATLEWPARPAPAQPCMGPPAESPSWAPVAAATASANASEVQRCISSPATPGATTCDCASWASISSSSCANSSSCIADFGGPTVWPSGWPTVGRGRNTRHSSSKETCPFPSRSMPAMICSTVSGGCPPGNPCWMSSDLAMTACTSSLLKLPLPSTSNMQKLCQSKPRNSEYKSPIHPVANSVYSIIPSASKSTRSA